MIAECGEIEQLSARKFTRLTSEFVNAAGPGGGTIT
jgi:hypothetical protein